MISLRVLRIGHRGAAGHAPENTLAAVAAGLSHGADLIEIDVQRTRDGALIVMHDKRVDRTTNGSGTVSDLTLQQIHALDAGGGQRVPTLNEVLALVTGRAGLIIELITPGIASQVAAAIARNDFVGPVIYASFLHAELLAVREANPDAETLALLEGVPISGASFALEAKAKYAGLSFDSVTPGFVRCLQQAGVGVFVYTLNDPRDIESAERMGVDGIITDFPDRVAPAQQPQGQR
jgi:glycerophosphoryl diester phosphodiesterase